MNASQFSRLDESALAALANGIIPPDTRDDGAAAVNPGTRLVARIHSGLNQRLYLSGLEVAQAIAQKKFGGAIGELTTREIHELLAILRDEAPGFFKQLRMDVSAAYLSDPEVWRGIGFPGPSIASGGYADFDQPQTRTVNELKEPPR